MNTVFAVWCFLFFCWPVVVYSTRDAPSEHFSLSARFLLKKVIKLTLIAVCSSCSCPCGIWCSSVHFTQLLSSRMHNGIRRRFNPDVRSHACSVYYNYFEWSRHKKDEYHVLALEVDEFSLVQCLEGPILTIVVHL